MCKLSRFIASKCSSGFPWLVWAAKLATMDEDMDFEVGEQSSEVFLFSAELQQLIFDRTQRAAWDIAKGGGDANGLPLNRQLKRRYESRTAGTRRTALNQLICIRSVGRADEVEQKLRHTEELIERCQTMS